MNRAVLLMLVSALGACDRSIAPGAVASPELVLLDSVELRDPQDAPIGTPGDLLALADGRVLLADPQNFRLLEYDARGELVRSIGKKGSGPGEFQQIGPIALDGDSLLHVLEPSVLQTLEFRSGSFVDRVKIPAPFATSVGAQDGAVYFRTLDSAQMPHVASWRGGSIVMGPPLPSLAELAEVIAAGAAANASMMNTALAGAAITVLSGDTTAILSQAFDGIIVATPTGIAERIPVARLHRQGNRPDVIARMASDPSVVQKDPQIMYTSSVPTLIARNAAGHYSTIVTDYTFLTTHFSAKLFLSVIDPQTKRSCPDARIPAQEDPRPMVALRGDTLFIVSQSIDDVTATTVLRKFLVRTADCNWIEAKAPR